MFLLLIKKGISMKKFLCLLAMLFIASPAFAGPRSSLDRQVVLDTPIKEVASTVESVIKSYEGVITVRELNNNEYRYVVDYNETTLLGILGVDNKNWANAKHAKATFSASLKQLGNNDVLITCRKHSYQLNPVYNHYKKIYNELKMNDKELIKYKKYKRHSKRG